MGQFISIHWHFSHTFHLDRSWFDTFMYFLFMSCLLFSVCRKDSANKPARMLCNVIFFSLFFYFFLDFRRIVTNIPIYWNLFSVIDSFDVTVIECLASRCIRLGNDKWNQILFSQHGISFSIQCVLNPLLSVGHFFFVLLALTLHL